MILVGGRILENPEETTMNSVRAGSKLNSRLNLGLMSCVELLFYTGLNWYDIKKSNLRLVSNLNLGNERINS